MSRRTRVLLLVVPVVAGLAITAIGVVRLGAASGADGSAAAGMWIGAGLMLVVLPISLAWMVRLIRHRLGLQSRQGRLPQVASALGLSFSEADVSGLIRLPFRAFTVGVSPGARNVMWGTYRGVQVAAFDHWYRDRVRAEALTDRWFPQAAHQAHDVVRRSAVLLQLPGVAPRLLIRPAGLDGVALDLGLQERVEFELEDFNDAFVVRSEDARFATAVVSQRAMQWLLDRRAADGQRVPLIEISGDRLLWSVPGYVEADRIPDLLDASVQFRAMIPDWAFEV